MMVYARIATVLFSLLIIHTSCNQSPQKTTEVVTSTSINRSTSKLLSTTGITKEDVNMIVDSCSHIDMLFNDFPVSMSQSDKNSIINDLTLISTDPLTDVPITCKPIGRKVYNGNGRVLLEADLYFSEGCLFLVFIRDEQALFGNLLNQKGVTFYNNLVSQIKAQKAG